MGTLPCLQVTLTSTRLDRMMKALSHVHCCIIHYSEVFINWDLASPQNLKAAMAEERTKGFSHVVVSSNLRDGFSLLIQSAGLGGMKHNAVLMAWPTGWTEARDSSARMNFIGKIHRSISKGQVTRQIIRFSVCSLHCVSILMLQDEMWHIGVFKPLYYQRFIFSDLRFR